jgi:hypothetical protein
VNVGDARQGVPVIGVPVIGVTNSKKEMRPVWRDRKDIEANLENRKVF